MSGMLLGAYEKYCKDIYLTLTVEYASSSTCIKTLEKTDLTSQKYQYALLGSESMRYLSK